MNYKLLFNTAMLAGEIMLKNGAEIYRVEDTMNRILKISGFKTTESFVTTTCIILTLDDADKESITSIKRVFDRGTNLNKIALVNEISRDFCDKKINLNEAYSRLSKVHHLPPYSKKIIFVFTALSPIFFYMAFSNNLTLYQLLVTLLCGVTLSSVKLILSKYSIIGFFSDLICSALVAILSSFCASNLYWDNNIIDSIIISSIMPLVPGVAITNAIRDTLYGDYLSGLSRATEAFIVAVSIALGVGLGLSLFKYF
jgi:uncharacterized membrane protein YjjP (DUF1212 family)